MENTFNYHELSEKLSRLQWLLHKSHLRDHAEYGPRGNPQRGQGRVLALLKLQPEISAKELSYLLGIRQQSLNELLNKLEKGGYIERKPSEKDKRIMMISLTDKGREQEQAEQDYTGIFACLNAEEQAAFGEYLNRVIAALEEQLGEDAAEGGMNPEKYRRMMMMRRDMHGRGHGHHHHHGHDPRGTYPGGHDPRGPYPGGHDPRGPYPGSEGQPDWGFDGRAWADMVDADDLEEVENTDE